MLPSWLFIDLTKLELSGVPAPTAAGTYDVKFTITDKAGDSAHTTFNLFVNEPPQVANLIEPIRVMRGRTTVVQIPTTTFSDANDVTLLYSVSNIDGSTLGEWITYEASTNMLSLAPGDGTEDVVMLVTATDSFGSRANTTMQIFVFADISPLSTAGRIGIVTGALLGVIALFTIVLLTYKLKSSRSDRIHSLIFAPRQDYQTTVVDKSDI